jgi:hypothetical protein
MLLSSELPSSRRLELGPRPEGRGWRVSPGFNEPRRWQCAAGGEA